MTKSGGRQWLHNRYWVLRHGRSMSNVKGINVCSMENGILEEYKLAPQGVDQARLAGESFKKILSENSIPLQDVRICYSPFSRTIHTTEVVASVLDLPFEGPQCKVMADLRERFFGPSYELSSIARNTELTRHDEKDPFLPPDDGGESVGDVASRLAKALASMESEFEKCAVLIVSHGDPLQILQTMMKAAEEVDVPEHEHDDDDDGKGDHHDDYLASRIQAITVSSVLSGHKSFKLRTGELRPISSMSL